MQPSRCPRVGDEIQNGLVVLVGTERAMETQGMVLGDSATVASQTACSSAGTGSTVTGRTSQAWRRSPSGCLRTHPLRLRHPRTRRGDLYHSAGGQLFQPGQALVHPQLTVGCLPGQVLADCQRQLPPAQPREELIRPADQIHVP